MFVKTGEVICVSSGIFESYSLEGPFVATKDFDLDVFVADAVKPLTEKWEIDSLLGEIPRMLLQCGLVTELPSRKIHLGAMGEVDVQEEKTEWGF